ncbi:hypothetical protein HYV56_00635 [Candidatus Peregrinibacteria bacterium]|nr:hypothetical protein [Candidatus Peregrinibacteria bacterium]
MFKTLGEHPELITTASLGTIGISEINKGSRAYQAGDFREGSIHLLVGNGTLTGLAATNELIKNGAVGIYTGAQTPFALAGLAHFLKHHRDLSNSYIYQLCVKAAEKFTALPALGINIAIRLWLYKNGLIDPSNALDWIRHLGFTGLSTSFVMSIEGSGKILRNLTAKQERFLVTFSTRAALTLALGVDVIDSGMDVVSSHDLNKADLLALIWMSLNAMALKQDFITLDKEIDHTISERIKHFGALVREKFFRLF